MKLKLIAPITDKAFEEESEKEAQKFISPGTVIDAQRIEMGTESIECACDDALAAPGIIKLGLECREQGYDGLFISCMADPAVEALRELVDIPVAGPCRTSLLYAADLCHRFSVITVTDGVVPLIERVAREVGVAGKLASCRAVNIPVLQLTDVKRLAGKLAELAVTAIERDGAQGIVLGCTGMVGVDALLKQHLTEEGHDVPVLYPVPIAIKYLETLVSLKLSHSRTSYPKAPDKERNIWSFLNGPER